MGNGLRCNNFPRVLDSELSRALCCGSKSQLARVLGELELSFPCAGGVNSASYAPPLQAVLSGDSAGNVRLWDLCTGQARLAMNNGCAVNVVAHVPQLKAIVSGDDEGRVTLWSAASGQQQRVLYPGALPVKAILYVPELSSIIAASGGRGVGNVVALDATTGEKTLKVLCAESPVSVCYISGPKAVAAGNHTWVTLWNWANGEKLWEMQGSCLPVVWIAHVAHLQAVVSGDSDGNVVLWDAQDGSRRSSIACAGGTAHAMAYAPDLRAIVVANSARTVRVYDVMSGMLLQSLACGYAVHSLAYAEELQSVVLGHHLGGKRLSALAMSEGQTGLVKILPLKVEISLVRDCYAPADEPGAGI
mmetsp:Transcript_101260/g.316482  ORF Transcript_101260/g.316482 Transcript_101260/m.316482 type:complete len:361 (-) Transcript_101260:87-1169(-)